MWFGFIGKFSYLINIKIVNELTKQIIIYMNESDDRTYKLLEKKLYEILNRGAPLTRIYFNELIQKDNPKIKLLDGSEVEIDKEELEYIRKILPENYLKILKIPIIIEVNPDAYGTGVYRISGVAESYLISKILNKERTKDDEIFIYRYELRKIRKLLPTTTQYVFIL